MSIARKLLLGTFATGLAWSEADKKEDCFIYRDDIGAFWGIKGYEEQVTEVGTHHGKLSWPQFRAWGTYDSGSVRRGNLLTIFLTKEDSFFHLATFRLPSLQRKLCQLPRLHGQEVRLAAGQGVRAARAGNMGR